MEETERVEVMEERKCPVCGGGIVGYKNKKCCSKKCAKRFWVSRNKEKYDVAMKKFYERNPCYRKEYYKLNREHIRTRDTKALQKRIQDNPEILKIYKRKYMEKHGDEKRKRERENPYKKAYREKHKHEHREYMKKYLSDNREYLKIKKSIKFKKMVDEMDDYYIAGLFISGTSLKRSDVPKNIIEAQRIQLTIKRIAKEIYGSKNA